MYCDHLMPRGTLTKAKDTFVFVVRDSFARGFAKED
jgi:hypothetical protein